MQSRRGGAHSCTVLLTRGRYEFATNESRCHESVQNVKTAIVLDTLKEDGRLPI